MGRGGRWMGRRVRRKRGGGRRLRGGRGRGGGAERRRIIRVRGGRIRGVEWLRYIIGEDWSSRVRSCWCSVLDICF